MRIRNRVCDAICGNNMWNTETSDPTGDEGLSNGFGWDGGDRNCFRPTSESINTGQEVSAKDIV